MATAPTAIEDYVKAIYAHTEWQSEKITATALAGRLGLAPSSVTEMVKKLGTQGLVDHQPYGTIELTPAGIELALRMVRRHRLIETWLVSQFGYSWDQVHDEAEVLEHSMSDRLLDAIDAQLGHPERDPHGDPIPSAAGESRKPDAVLLAELEPGTQGSVARISDRDPKLLRQLESAGVALDVALVRTAGSASLDGQELPVAALDSVWVAVGPRQAP